MENTIARIELENAMRLSDVEVVSSDYDKIVGKLPNNSIVLVYLQNMCVVEKSFVKMEKNTPIVSDGKDLYYTDIESFICIMEVLNK